MVHHNSGDKKKNPAVNISLEHLQDFAERIDSLELSERLFCREIFLKLVGAGDMEKVNYLLETRLAPLDVRDGQGRTALMHAAASAGDEMLNFLLGRGAVLDESDKKNRTALMFAVGFGRLENVKILLKAGADFLEARNHRDETPFMQAVRRENLDVMAFLLEQGVNVNQSSNPAIKILSYTPLMMAASNGDLPTLQILLDKGAELGARDLGGRSALDFAVLHLSNSSSANETSTGQSPDDETLIRLSLRAKTPVNDFRRLEVIKYLLEKGAEVGEKTSGGKSLKDIAMGKGQFQAAGYLDPEGKSTEKKGARSRFRRWFGIN